MRVLIALVYSVVCVLGLVGNLLALFLLHSRRRGHHHSSIDCFVMSLALTDLQFVLTLPFWAVDTVMDFRWPFGRVMCKIVSSVTTMNMYASVFFLTAMSVTRYRSLVTSLKMESPRKAAARAKWASLAIWVVSLVATLPHAFYSTTVQVRLNYHPRLPCWKNQHRPAPKPAPKHNICWSCWVTSKTSICCALVLVCAVGTLHASSLVSFLSVVVVHRCLQMTSCA